EAGPRWAALPPERRRPPRVRGPPGAPAPPAQRPLPGAPPPLPDPAVLQGRADQPEDRPGPGLGHVDVRPHRRGPDREAPPAAEAGRDRGPHAHAPGRPAGG